MRSSNALAPALVFLLACSESEAPVVLPAHFGRIQLTGPATCAVNSAPLDFRLYCGAAIGATFQLHAIARDSFNTELGALQVKWTSSDARIARVSKDGVVIGTGVVA